MSAQPTVNSMYLGQEEIHCRAYISELFTPWITAIDLLNKLFYIQNDRYVALLAVRTGLVSGHFLLCSQGDSMRQRHGDGCRVPVSHHLFINLKSFTYNSISEDADVFFSLYDTREAKQIRYVEESQGTQNSPEWSCSAACMHARQTHTHTHVYTLSLLTEAFCG